MSYLNSENKIGQLGFTLVEVMIASGIAGLLSLAVGHMLVTTMQSQKSVAISMDVSQIASSVQALLANGDACYAAIGGGAYAPAANSLANATVLNSATNAPLTIHNPQGLTDVTLARTIKYSACAWTGTPAALGTTCRPTPDLQITDLYFETKTTVAGPYARNYRSEFKNTMKWPASLVGEVVNRYVVNGEAVITLRKIATGSGNPNFTRRFGLTLTIERDTASGGAWKVARCSGGGGEGLTENTGWDDDTNCNWESVIATAPPSSTDCATLSITLPAATCPPGKYIAETKIEYRAPFDASCTDNTKKGGEIITQTVGPFNDTRIKCCNVPR